MMRKTAALAAVVFMFIGAAAFAQTDPCAEPVETTAGMVRGAMLPDSESCVWKGIPYAAPPVGGMRWRAPAPAVKWDGVRDALEFGDICVQRPGLGFEKVRSMEGMSEDCLFLNVYRPKKSGVFPVMVWIHGGGYVFGSGNGYAGGGLAAFGDVVVVTINYRLGIFGFMAHPALRAEDPHRGTGGYGVLDQVAALEWVRDNIAAFGGDPGNVTIFGESAGGWAVCTLMASPLARRLFHRAIMESQGCNASTDLEKGYEQAGKAAATVGCAQDNIGCMRAVPAKTLANKCMGGPLGAGFPWLPRVDGWLLDASPLNIIRAGDYNRVPFMAGSTRNEFDMAVIAFPSLYYALPSQYGKKLQKGMGMSDDELRRALKAYPLSDYGNRPRKAYGRMLSDAGISCNAYLGIEAVAEREKDVYYYRFDYDDMKYGKITGAMHSSEIPFVFGSLDSGGYGSLYNKRNIEKARALSETMMGYWTNFAKGGDPNGPGLPAWPRFDLDTKKVQVLDTEIATEDSKMDARCGFWDDYWKVHPDMFETLGRPDQR